MTKATIKAILLISLMASGFNALAANANKELINNTLETLRLSINAHDYAMLKPLLDDDFSYQGRGSMMSTMIMRQIVEDYPQQVSAINVISIKPADGGWTVDLRLEGKASSSQRQVTISEDYLILRADLADIQIIGHG